MDILVVEDNLADKILFEELLMDTDLNPTLYHAECISEAQDLLEDKEIDVIVLDLSLPDSDGLSGFKNLKESFPAIPIVIVTGLDDYQLAEKAILSGAQDYMVKGKIQPELLDKIILYAIYRHKINDQLRKLNNRLDKLVYSVSHDLRNPVVNLQSLLQIYKGEQDSEHRAKVLEHIESTVIKLEQMIGDMNDVIKLEHNLDDMELVDINKIYVDVVQSLEESIARKKVLLYSDFRACTPFHFYKAKLYSMLQNLITNAIKFCSLNEIPVIEIAAQKADKNIYITIRDNGIGISKDNQDKIFRMFYKDNLQVAGRGIGLYMVKTVAENNGGWVKVESEEGKGTLFTVCFKEKTYELTKKDHVDRGRSYNKLSK